MGIAITGDAFGPLVATARFGGRGVALAGLAGIGATTLFRVAGRGGALTGCAGNEGADGFTGDGFEAGAAPAARNENALPHLGHFRAAPAACWMSAAVKAWPQIGLGQGRFCDIGSISWGPREENRLGPIHYQAARRELKGQPR